MPSSSQKSSGRALLSLTLVAGVLVSLVSGCARSTAENEVDPDLAPLLAKAQVADTSGVQKRHHEPIASLLQRSTPGVRVSTNPDGSITVRIRGSSSFHGSEEPLYVIDGVPLPPGTGGRLAGINPYDILSIKVLKDPPETTLYGVRGANGVVLITTRRP
ncbi:MAG: TonB-dependent receptor plug domain-containing protein [Gemmatimonadota bacterium]|nr:MAG: TonB-dependent receptor plug domain-containing protein [Gemmatimonadota bacterium]